MKIRRVRRSGCWDGVVVRAQLRLVDGGCEGQGSPVIIEVSIRAGQVHGDNAAVPKCGNKSDR